jgi:hypothetical protein
MQVMTFSGTETRKVFQLTDSFSGESLRNQTIIVYQTSLPVSVFVPVNMYDVDMGRCFGIPIIVNLAQRTNYVDLEEQLMAMLLRFSRPNYPEPDPLMTWWEENVVQAGSLLVETQGLFISHNFIIVTFNLSSNSI